MVTSSRLNLLCKFCQENRRSATGATIIYVRTRDECESTAKFLTENGVKAFPYHAELSQATRDKNQDLFRHKSKPIVCATTAFGMVRSSVDENEHPTDMQYDFPKIGNTQA